MAKILVIGDPHFKHDNKDDTDILECEIRCLLINNQYDAVVVLGDVLHNHEKINSRVFKRAINFLNTIRLLVPHTYLLIGNHDMISNTVYLTDDHAFNCIKYWDKITCVDRPIMTQIKDFNFVFCPYVKPGLFFTALNELNLDNFNNIKAVFAHQEFKGAKMGAITSKNGDEWPSDYPLCISGHIHQYQELSSNLIYVGTPYQETYGDTDRKTVSVFEFSDNNFIQTRLELNIPQKIQIRLTPEQLATYVPTSKKTKIKVFGDTKIISEIMKLDSVKSLIEMGIIITVEASKKTNNYSITNKQNFSRKVKSYFESLNDSELYSDFENLFPFIKNM